MFLSVLTRVVTECYAVPVEQSIPLTLFFFNYHRIKMVNLVLFTSAGRFSLS